MLDVAFGELPSRRSKQMRSRQIRPRQQQREHVLQLIAEAERAARLVVAGARPEAAAHILVQQPPVHQHVEGIVRRADLDRLERSAPRRLDLFQRDDRIVNRGVTRDQLFDVAGVGALTQQEHDAALLAWRQDDLHVKRRAGIQPRAEPRLERQMTQRVRPGQRSVAADERQTMRRGRGGRLARTRERDAPSELVVEGIARENRPPRRVVCRRDLPRLTLARRTEHPVVVRKDAQGSRGAAVVGQRQECELHWIVDVDEHVELVADASRRA